MVFYILIAIVFMAELVITFTILLHLLKLSKMFQEYSSVISELNPKIKEIMELCRKISEQMLEFAPIVVNMIQNTIRDIIIGQIKNLVSALTFWVVKGTVEKHLSR